MLPYEQILIFKNRALVRRVFLSRVGVANRESQKMSLKKWQKILRYTDTHSLQYLEH